ncbi:phosphodiester glycosidase family protein [Rapidithrix thailandica]|uniref:Phosphodiester glycosidase family protein n=1 Tax=Rapidithrix thailandica TaxID=413964 RepID=A0AAW9SM62_9BACT
MYNKIKYFVFLLSFSLIPLSISCKSEDVKPEAYVEYAPITQALLDSTNLISKVFSDTTFTVAPGVEETDIHYLSMSGLTMRIFFFKVDLKQEGLSLVPITPYGSTGYAMQTIPDMLPWVDASLGKVVAAVNADFFNMSTGEPRGVVHVNGEAVRTSLLENRSFFGLDKQGKLVIGSTEEYPEFKENLEHALGGGDVLIKDYAKPVISNQAVHPRTAVGITANEEVYFMVVDGRQFDYSNGMTLSELSDVFYALGVKDAANLDGGGSSTFVSLHSDADVWHIRNRPSDGDPRPVANGWAVSVLSE